MNVIEAINRYTGYRVNLGEKVHTLKYLLLGFGKHVGSDRSLDRISEETCHSYLSLKGTRNGIPTSYWFCIYAAISGLYKWAMARGYAEYCPLPKYKPQKPETFKPYIYTMEELNRIFGAALMYRKRFNIEYPVVIQTMLKVTCFLGLRPSEAVNLHIDDIDVPNRLVTIRETKFYKSRVVPVSEPVMKIIRDYISWRSETARNAKAAGNHLFIDRRNRHVKLTALQQAFRLICTKADVHRHDTGRCDVRLQDLRHTFATNRVIQWYNEGLDVQGLLPALSTYLGHCNLDSTYEVVYNLTDKGMGQSTAVGVGGDPVVGLYYRELLEMFENDPETDSIALIGEIGGDAEERAAEYIRDHVTKPVAVFIAGQQAPPGKQMGHAGAIISSGSGTAAEKIAAFEAVGVPVAKEPSQIPDLLRRSR